MKIQVLNGVHLKNGIDSTCGLETTAFAKLVVKMCLVVPLCAQWILISTATAEKPFLISTATPKSGSRKTANPRSIHRTVLLVWYWSILSVDLTCKSVQSRFGDWRDMDTATSMISGITKNIVDCVLKTWLLLNLEFSKSGKISAEQQLSFYLVGAYNRTDTTTGALGMKHGATLFYS